MATEISLKSASISGLTAEQSTEQLSGLVASWGLTIPQLNSAFEQMNAMAVRFNSSDKELMSALARTGALAHEMGMDLSEAMSLVSLISGTTGRPGAEAGNALKRYMVNLGKPDVQEKLAQNFGVKIFNEDGTLKNQRELLNTLSLAYKALDDEQWIKEGKNAVTGPGFHATISWTTRCGCTCSCWRTIWGIFCGKRCCRLRCGTGR